MKRTEIEQLLPGIFQRTIQPGNPLDALLAVMEGQHAPDETILTTLDGYFDPYRCPDHFVAYLSGWVDMDRFVTDAPLATSETVPPFPSGTGRLRDLIATSSYLARWRGTNKGLLRFLETATGLAGFSIEERVFDEQDKLRPFHIRVRAPQEAARCTALIQKIIESEKPAYVTYELQVGDTPISMGATQPFRPQPPRPPVTPVDPSPPTPPIVAQPAPTPTPPPVITQPQPTPTPPVSPQPAPPASSDTPTKPEPVQPQPVPPPATPVVVLARLENPATGRTYPITSARTIIGRLDPATGARPTVDLTADDTSRLVSRQHARILARNGAFYLIEDNGVPNGTYINGQRIQSQDMIPLNDGDSLMFGQVVVVFRKQ